MIDILYKASGPKPKLAKKNNAKRNRMLVVYRCSKLPSVTRWRSFTWAGSSVGLRG